MPKSCIGRGNHTGNLHATVISFSSEYFLRNIETETRDNAIYITEFKTTLLGNSSLEQINLILLRIEMQENIILGISCIFCE